MSQKFQENRKLTYTLFLPDTCCGWIDTTEAFLSIDIVLREKIKFPFKFF